MRAILSWMIFTLTTLLVAADERTVGIEGATEVTLKRGDYQAKPLDDRTPLIIRIDEVTPHADGSFTYDLHYIGMEHGAFFLKDYLILPDGNAAEELGDRKVEVGTVLPPGHSGELAAYAPRPFPWMGGYRMMLAILAAVWLIGLGLFAWLGRKRKVAPPPPEIPAPTYAERLRPFIEAAAQGKLSTQEQAELERLLTGYWRDRLALPDQRMSEAIATLKRHDEAGPLLLALERWLHRPGNTSAEEIEKLLQPYHHSTAPARDSS